MCPAKWDRDVVGATGGGARRKLKRAASTRAAGTPFVIEFDDDGKYASRRVAAGRARSPPIVINDSPVAAGGGEDVICLLEDSPAAAQRLQARRLDHELMAVQVNANGPRVAARHLHLAPGPLVHPPALGARPAPEAARAPAAKPRKNSFKVKREAAAVPREAAGFGDGAKSFDSGDLQKMVHATIKRKSKCGRCGELLEDKLCYDFAADHGLQHLFTCAGYNTNPRHAKPKTIYRLGTTYPTERLMRQWAILDGEELTRKE